MESPNYPKSNGKENKKAHENNFRGPSLPKIIAEVKEITQDLFKHPAENPRLNLPCYRGSAVFFIKFI